MCGEDTSSVSPTLGFNIRDLELGGYRLTVWDVGGQKTLRCARRRRRAPVPAVAQPSPPAHGARRTPACSPYWRNYFEETDALVWVVDSADRRRLADCAAELHGLLKEERLAGASLLVLANKQVRARDGGGRGERGPRRERPAAHACLRVIVRTGGGHAPRDRPWGRRMWGARCRRTRCRRRCD